eukprot:1134319-Pelagomonas_calceolata.AAC.6
MQHASISTTPFVLHWWHQFGTKPHCMPHQSRKCSQYSNNEQTKAVLAVLHDFSAAAGSKNMKMEGYLFFPFQKLFGRYRCKTKYYFESKLLPQHRGRNAR